MKNRNNPNLAAAKMNRGRGTPASIRADSHQADEQIRIGHLWSDGAGAGEVPIADGAGGVYWGAAGGGGGAFAYTASPDYSLYGPYNTAPVAGVDSAIQIGIGAQAIRDNCIAIGYGASNDGITGVAIGHLATIDPANTMSTVIGPYANASNYGQRAVAVGAYAKIDGGDYGVAVGYLAESLAYHAVSIGNDSSAGATDSIAIGHTATIGGGVGESYGAVAIGQNATIAAYSYDVVAIGHGTNVGTFAKNSIAIGLNAAVAAYGYYGIAIGYSADVQAGNHTRAMAIGSGAQAGNDNCVAIGGLVVNTAASSFRIGVGATQFLHFDDWTPAAGATTPAHFIEVELNAGRYRIPLEAIP